MKRFKNIGVTGRQDGLSSDLLVRLIQFLQSYKVTVSLDEKLALIAPNFSGQKCNRLRMGAECDLVIVLGGDGSFLGAGRELCSFDIPVVGVNQGRLGFLTDLYPLDLEKSLSEILKGKYTSERRFLLHVSQFRDGKLISQTDALNDVVLHAGKPAKMLEYKLEINNQFVYQQRADGLVLSSPTGSTAYGLSGGGPVLHPELDALTLVPMFPHQLANRPLVVKGDSQLRLTIVNPPRNASCQISCDGNVCMTISLRDHIIIGKKDKSLVMLHPVDYDFYKACRKKLGWNDLKEE